MSWEVRQANNVTLNGLLEEGWEPFGVHADGLWLRREKRWVAAVGDRVDPATVCSACGEKLGHGHADDCPRLPKLAAAPPTEAVA